MLGRILKTFLAPYRSLIAALIALQFLATLAMLFLPSLNADIIDKGVARGDTGYIVRVGTVMLLVSVGQVLCSVAAVWLASRVSMGFGRDVRRSVFQRVMAFSGREVARYGAPSLVTRATNDVQQIQMMVQMSGTMVVSAPIMMVGSILMALHVDSGLSWLLAVCVPVLIAAVLFVATRMVPSFRVMQERIDTVNRVLREQISGIRVVRAFVREPQETARFAVANEQLTAVGRTVGRWLAVLFPLAMLVLNITIVAVFWFGAHRVDAGQMEVGALTAFMSYLFQILMSVMMATFVLSQAPRAAVSADRIQEVLDTESTVVPPVDAITPAASRAGLELDGAGFTYPGADDPVLTDISFVAPPGRTTAIIGSTGSGKSTLVNLIPRLYDATQGTVRIDGVDVRDLAPSYLSDAIGLVPQQGYLFSGTIRSNLRYGRPDATDEELWEALEVAQAKDFVEAKPEGLDAPIAQGGTNVSGGQRQRLAIARALIKKPGIYLFDDSFSALDVATDARLRRALKPHTADAAVVIVAQRVATILDADQIIVLDDGRIVGAGTHAELLATNPTYQEIVRSQLTEEEVA